MEEVVIKCEGMNEHMGVSKNRGTHKPSILGYPYFWNTHIAPLASFPLSHFPFPTAFHAPTLPDTPAPCFPELIFWHFRQDGRTKKKGGRESAMVGKFSQFLVGPFFFGFWG